MKPPYDVIIIGAGAAGLLCSIEAGKRGRRVWLVDHATRIAEKIRISGGGRCNFTNLNTRPDAFLSRNRHFCKSALSRFTQQDFIALVEKHAIAFHEKKLGQLFCDDSAQQIIDMLLREAAAADVEIATGTKVLSVARNGDDGFSVETDAGTRSCTALVIATGGLSIPKIGASGFGYAIARQFGLAVTETVPGLVPLTFQADLLDFCKALTGLSVDAVVTYGKTRFREGMLFTHRGLSGPSILQISSYWRPGNMISINLLPDTDLFDWLRQRKRDQPRQELQTAVSQLLPNRLAQAICEREAVAGRLADLPDARLRAVADAVNHWQVLPGGTEGYRTAEVTLGGVDTAELSSQTMEAKKQPGLYFIGEVVDVTGHLGGYNFQWAWSSGYVAGQYV